MAITLAECPEVRTYKSSQLAKLEADLDATDAATSVESVAGVNDILLNSKCLTVSGGYKLTTVALSQLSRALCPGLAKVVADLSGIGMLVPPRQLKNELAVSIFNEIAKVRFDQLTDKSLVRQLKAKRIDGIIGAGYRTLSNKSFFDITQDATATIPANFHSATLTGRTLTMCYVFKEPFATKPDVFYGGYYFTNSEVGDCSVKIASLVLHQRSNYRAISPYKKGRMVHIGRSFTSRVRTSVYSAIAKPWPSDWLKSRLAKLPAVPLGFDKLDEKKSMIRFDELVSKLARKGLGAQLAERVVSSALYQGKETDTPKAYDIEIRRQLWKTRTAYDMFISLMRDASGRSLAVRESIEKVAFDLLQGSIVI